MGILNDFEAVGYGIPALEESDIVPINMVISEPHVSLSRTLGPVRLMRFPDGCFLTDTLPSFSGPQGGDGPWHGPWSGTADVG